VNNFTQYAPDMIHRQALRFIEQNSRQPFFAYLAYTLPHAELLVPQDELLWQFEGRFEEKPYMGKKPGDSYGPDMTVSGYAPQPEPYSHFAAMVARLDKYVGEVLDKLEELGIGQNTVVIFTSDNGPHSEGGADPAFFDSNGPWRGGKRDLYEGGIRLPLIVSWPRSVQPGRRSDHVCANWDMMPTIADMAGVKIPGSVHTDGISILPVLTGKGRQKQHEYLYWEFHEQKGKLAVRTGKWKGVVLNFSIDPAAKMELYDLLADPGEQNDIAALHPAICEQIAAIMCSARTPSPEFELKNVSRYRRQVVLRD
jgi:arylsulfatase A-like enzyme